MSSRETNPGDAAGTEAAGTDAAGTEAAGTSVDGRLLFVNLELTLRCNLRCLHCGSTAGRPRRAELTTNQWIDVVGQLADLGCQEVCVLGGEPLVRRDWRDVASAICDHGMDLVLITNGWSVDEKVVRQLQKLERLDRIGVSLDGADAQTHDRLRGRDGSFERARGALWMLRDAGFEVGAITAVSRLNLEELLPLRDLLVGQDITWQLQTVAGHGERWSPDWNLTPEQHYQVAWFIAASRAELGVKALPVAGSHGIGYHSDRISGYAELPDWPGCHGGLVTLGLCSNGDVKPCLSQPDSSVVGHLATRSLREIWEDDRLFTRNRQFERTMLDGFCAQCPHAMTCRGGCPNLPSASHGSDRDNAFCLYRLEQEGRVPPDPLKEGWLR